MPLARLEKNRSRTPLLPEPTAMDMLYDQLKVSRGLCLCNGENNVHAGHAEQQLHATECIVHMVMIECIVFF